MRKKKVEGRGATNLSLKEIDKLKGQTRLVRHGDEDCFFPVEITRVEAKSCGIKVTAKPFDGIGELELCLSAIHTAEQAQKILDNEVKEAQIEGEIRAVTQLRYHADRKAAFIALVEKELPPDELEKLKQEVNGGLSRADKYFIERVTREIIERKHGGPVENPEDDDWEY